MYETVTTPNPQCPHCGGGVPLDSRFCKHCGGDLAQITPAVTERAAVASKSKTGWLIGGLALLLVVALLSVFLVRSRQRQVAPAAAPSQTMGVRAQQIEAQILNGATLSQTDVVGLSAYELRVLRNIHFARYGRSYDRPGLGDYFFTRSWYKPDATYHDKLLTATDKANINLLLAQENQMKATEAMAAPAPNPSTQSTVATSVGAIPAATLTTENVQRAVEQAFEEMKSYGAKHNMPFKEGARVQVLGIQEMPAQNSARVDIRYINTIFRQPWSFKTEYTRLSEGTAVLKRYNDGRWVLTDLNTGDIMSFGGINTRIEIR